MSVESGQVKKLPRGARVIVYWLALVLGFLVVWQFLAKHAPPPSAPPGEAQDPAVR